MIHVDAPTCTVEEDRARIAARVHFDDPPAALDGETAVDAWYEVPAAYADAVTLRADAFAAALLPVALQQRAPLRIDAPLSARLAHGLNEYQRLLATWFTHLSPVPLEVNRYDGPSTSADGVATMFSGGLDSFYTLHQHLPEHEPLPAYRLTHGLFIHGFDVGLSFEAAYDRTRDRYAALFGDLDLTLIPVRTNVKVLLNHFGFGAQAVLGPLLMSVPLLLQPLLRVCYVPAGLTYAEAGVTFEENHPLVDHRFSTEALQVVHDGAAASRVEKTAAVAAWPPCRDHLCVCGRRAHTGADHLNCGRCQKCVMTLLALDLLGQDGYDALFAHPVDWEQFATAQIGGYANNHHFFLDLLHYARAHGLDDRAAALARVLTRSRRAQRLRALVPDTLRDLQALRKTFPTLRWRLRA